MVLEIYKPAEDGFVQNIDWNHEEIKQEVMSKVEHYKNLVYTDEQIKEAKSDRAALRKFVDVLETKRKEIKKQCMAPYEKFEAQLKEITAIVNEPIALIDTQVKEYEKKLQEEKKESIKELFASIGFQPFVELEQIADPKWLNASVSLKKIEEQMKERLVAIGNDIMTINNLPEFSFEALEVYKRDLDLAGAIREGQRLADIQKRKIEYEAQQKAKAEAEALRKAEQERLLAEQQKQQAFMAASEPEVQQKREEPPVQQELQKQWISFKAYLAVEDALALKEFFNTRNIQFESI